MSKLLLSFEQGKKVCRSYDTYLGSYYNVLKARLLTTLDSVIENDRQLKGLKSRVGDIQSTLWEKLYREIRNLIDVNLEFRKEKEEDNRKVANDIEIGKKMKNILGSIIRIIHSEFSDFESRLKNLMGVVFANNKLECVNNEIGEISKRIRNRINSLISEHVYEEFEIPVEDLPTTEGS